MNNNKLIAEFMGYKLGRCSNGFAWESPHRKWIDDVFRIHGRLWREDDTKYCWHSDWNWLMEVVEKIQRCLMDDNTLTIGYRRCEIECFEKGYSIIVSDEPTIRATYKAVVEFIKEYNKH